LSQTQYLTCETASTLIRCGSFDVFVYSKFKKKENLKDAAEQTELNSMEQLLTPKTEVTEVAK